MRLHPVSFILAQRYFKASLSFPVPMSFILEQFASALTMIILIAMRFEVGKGVFPPNKPIGTYFYETSAFNTVFDGRTSALFDIGLPRDGRNWRISPAND